MRIFFHNLKVSMMKLHLQKSMILKQVLPLILLISTLFTPYNVKADNNKENASNKSFSPPLVVKTWVGGTGNWNVPAKWSPAGIPLPTDVVEISGASSVVTVPKGYWAKAQQIILDGCSLTLNGTSRLTINGSSGDGLLMNQGTVFLNKGTLEIDNVMLNGISTVGTTSTSTFTNSGIIKIGSRSTPIGGKGIYLTKTSFTNTNAGRLFIDNTVNDFAMILTSSSNFTNDGEISLGTVWTVNQGIDSPDDFINNGILTFASVSVEGVSAQTKIINLGTIDVTLTNTLDLQGTIENQGFITIDGTLNNNGSMINSGFLTIFPDGKLIDNGAFMSEAFIRNYGILEIAAGKTLDMIGLPINPLDPLNPPPPATFYNETSGIVNVIGTFNTTTRSSFTSNGTTQGDFNIYQSGDFNNDVNSRIAPGKDLGFDNGIGMLTSNGSLDLMSGMLDIGANGSTSALYDYLTVVGSVTIGTSSKLQLVYGGGWSPITGDEITVIKSSTPVTGRFEPANLLIPSGWTVRYDYPATGDVTLTYVQVLPVELLSFKAVNKGVSNLLTWETASEVTNKGFEVQRKNEQGDWSVMGFVKGNGVASVYNFTDNDPLSISYYRLRQVDHDGKSEMSNIVSVTKERKLNVQVYPNPTHGKVTVQLANEAKANIMVYNLVGQVVIANEVVSTMGELDLSGLARGTYIVEIKSEGSIARQKIVKQ
jgi:Secretion system C-terminal sorting domain